MIDDEEVETDGRFGLHLGTNTFELPQAELVAQLHPHTHEAAKEAAEKSMANPAVLNKKTSALWDVERFDPFQQFKVDQERCAKLTVIVENGTDITNGWLHDKVDTPDPYVKLEIKGTPNGSKKTTSVNDNKNPVWNQAFHFHVPDRLSDRDDAGLILDVKLKDDDVVSDDNIGHYSINLKELGLKNGEMKKIQATFGNGSKVNLTIIKALDESEPDLRYSLALCDEEKHFLIKRREIAFAAMQKLLGPNSGPDTQKQVPVIGILGSGGGFRAMVGLSAVFCTLYEEGIMDCASYVAALSGSTWYLSFLYSHPDFPEKGPCELKDELRDAVSRSLPIVIAKGIFSYVTKLKDKLKMGQPISLTDLFGHIIGDMLLNKRKNATLSSQRRTVYDGKAPLPIYSCLNVKSNVPANVYQDWVEFTPYECGMPKYGSFMKTEHFGNKFYVGKIIRTFPEMPLHFLQGIWGSGFCILLRRFFNPWGDVHKKDADQVDYKENIHIFDGLEDEKLKDFKKPSHYDDDSSSGSEIEEDEVDSLFRGDDKQKAKKGWQFGGMMKFYLKSLLAETHVLDTRKGRAGLVFNPLRGLNPEGTYPMSPLTPTKSEDDLDFKGFYEHTKCSAKKMYMVDAGLNFNIPFPVLLRPQRGVELYLSFDFTDRGGDESSPFEELKLAEQWARLNHLPFPPVTLLSEEYAKEEMREFYVFEDENDDSCPVIIHFVLCNKQFRQYKAPGVPRMSDKEKKYADFKIYDDPGTPYSTYNFHYTGEQFDRLHELVEFNVRLGLPEVKRLIEVGVERKKTIQSKGHEPQQQLRPRVKLGSVPARGKMKQRTRTDGESGKGQNEILYTSSFTLGKLKNCLRNEKNCQ